MNMNEIPTPETDAFFRQDALKNLDKYPAAAFARDLERRLAIARDALEILETSLRAYSLPPASMHSIVQTALTQTAPKL